MVWANGISDYPPNFLNFKRGSIGSISFSDAMCSEVTRLKCLDILFLPVGGVSMSRDHYLKNHNKKEVLEWPIWKITYWNHLMMNLLKRNHMKIISWGIPIRFWRKISIRMTFRNMRFQTTTLGVCSMGWESQWISYHLNSFTKGNLEGIHRYEYDQEWY